LDQSLGRAGVHLATGGGETTAKEPVEPAIGTLRGHKATQGGISLPVSRMAHAVQS
jgi:hypothetical protein